MKTEFQQLKDELKKKGIEAELHEDVLHVKDKSGNAEGVIKDFGKNLGICPAAHCPASPAAARRERKPDHFQRMRQICRSSQSSFHRLVHRPSCEALDAPDAELRTPRK